MSFFDDLSQGSKYHKARLLPDGASLEITVADVDDEKCLRGFQRVIAEAEDEGNVILKHQYTQRGLLGWLGPVYDRAVVLLS